MVARATRSPAVSFKATAIRLLARREYARAELHARLMARGASRDEVERVLDELERLGYLSDARFAQALVAHKAGRYAKRAIAHELRQKGVTTAAAEDALAALAPGDELAQATALWRKRFGTPSSDEREKARQVRYLLARGYSMSVVLKMLRTVGNESVDSND